MGSLSHFPGGVGHRNGETGRQHYGQIHQIIANYGSSFVSNIYFLLQSTQHLKFITNSLKYSSDIKILGTMSHCLGSPPGYQGHFNPSLKHHADANTVSDVKSFDFLTGIGIDDASIGKNAVNIQNEESDLLGPTIDLSHIIIEALVQ
jgi:hypothetical protein